MFESSLGFFRTICLTVSVVVFHLKVIDFIFTSGKQMWAPDETREIRFMFREFIDQVPDREDVEEIRSRHVIQNDAVKDTHYRRKVFKVHNLILA